MKKLSEEFLLNLYEESSWRISLQPLWRNSLKNLYEEPLWRISTRNLSACLELSALVYLTFIISREPNRDRHLEQFVLFCFSAATERAYPTVAQQWTIPTCH
jgi:hypothetical protein